MSILECLKNDVTTKGFEEWREYTETLLTSGAVRRTACSTCAVLNPFNAFAFLLKGARPTQSANSERCLWTQLSDQGSDQLYSPASRHRQYSATVLVRPQPRRLACPALSLDRINLTGGVESVLGAISGWDGPELSVRVMLHERCVFRVSDE